MHSKYRQVEKPLGMIWSCQQDTNLRAVKALWRAWLCTLPCARFGLIRYVTKSLLAPGTVRKPFHSPAWPDHSEHKALGCQPIWVMTNPLEGQDGCGADSRQNVHLHQPRSPAVSCSAAPQPNLSSISFAAAQHSDFGTDLSGLVEAQEGAGDAPTQGRAGAVPAFR